LRLSDAIRRRGFEMRLIIDRNRAPAPLAVIQLKYRPDGG
jgi:hypothetical protein